VGVVLEFGILGPFETRVGGGDALALGGLRQRALLAILVLHANEVVSTDRLIDLLWGEHPPATAAHTVQVFVSRLRSALGAAGDRLLTRPPGYTLEVAVDELDAERFERSYADARAALAADDASRAAALLHESETLWRGPPLAEFTYEPFAQATIARLEELRLSAREELIDADLMLGRHAKVVSELEALVREQPLRERPRGQLMLALYRCGRQADALDAFRQARRMLVDELAVEPSNALRELEQAILRQEASLQAPSQPSPAVHVPPDDPQVAASDQGSDTIVRKTATVLAARLTAAAPADPEVERELIALARQEAERIVRHHGGAFVSGLGGELVGIFGVPLIQEDDALRALRAADELRARIAALSADGPGELVIGVGVDSGEVVVEAPDEVFGEPLNGAIGLARGAPNQEVVLSRATRRLASDAIWTEPAGDEAGWRLLGLVADAPAIPRRLRSPMVGRDDALAAARSAFERAARAGDTQLLTVIGEAGIGKSRLAQELTDELDGRVTILTGRCLSYGEGVAFWPLREALTQAAGGESRDAIRGLLGDAPDADLVADVIAAALGLASAESVAEQIPWAFRRVLEVLASRRPLLFVIDDAHWAEAPLLDLVDYLVDWLSAPSLLLCLSRPELLDVRPRWGGGHHRVSSIVLVPLSDQEMLRLLGHRLGERQLSVAESARILQTAEGNPLFVEQLLAMSAEEPLLGGEREIPGSIQSLLAARLDRLGPGERAVIERAAVIGREFSPEAAIELLPPDAQPSAGQHLRSLVRRELIHPAQSNLAGEQELRFHHILIRDVAYRSTPKALRSELHERFGDWLARRGEGYDEFVGYHLEQAFRYRSELGRVDAVALVLGARAAEALAAAGRQALSRGDSNAGVKLLRSSADLFDAGGNKQPELLLDLGGALSDSGDFGDAERVLQTALAQARETQADALGARALIELSFRRALVDPSVPVAAMLAVAEQAVEVFDRVGDEGGIARAWHHTAVVHWIRSQGAEMERALERALTHAERAGDRREQSRILGYLARATVTGPRHVDDGIQRCSAILERAKDDVVLTAVTETMLAVLEAMRGGFDEARAHWARSKRRLENVGLSITVAVLQMYSAFIELMAETPENAVPEVSEAYAFLERIGEGHRRATTAAVLARLLFAQGRYGECEAYCRITQETASEDDLGTQVIWRGTHGRLMARAGKSRLAEDLVDGGVALAEKTDFLMLHGDALSDRAEVLTVLDRPEQAARDLEHAIALYERKGIRVSAEAARRSYRSLSSSAAAPVADRASPA
jgi:DNA-binding SARP family transcriptional activator/class 3 adenylate cyclase/tetratricopeptide (TPR) repeat protein